MVSYILKLQCMFVYLSVWAVPGRFFQSLPVPCGVFWGVREGRARWSTGLGGPARAGEGGTGEKGPGGGELDRCIMHRVHTSSIKNASALLVMELESLELLWQNTPLPATHKKKVGPLHSMTHFIRCMEIPFVKLTTTICNYQWGSPTW
jgi:hypothetical protein